MFLDKPRAVFAGTGRFAARQLAALHEVVEIPFVVTIATKKPSPVALMAAELGLPAQTPKHIQDIADEIRAAALDVLVVADYGFILPPQILNITANGVVNVHPSLLPKHRGPAPIPAAILAGDATTGVTLMRMDDKMDHGPIIAQVTCTLAGSERADDLEATLSNMGAQLLKENIIPYLLGTVVPTEQDHSLATKHGFMKRDDGRIQTTDSANDVDRKFRAYYPWPGVWIETEMDSTAFKNGYADLITTVRQ